VCGVGDFASQKEEKKKPGKKGVSPLLIIHVHNVIIFFLPVVEKIN
jgi:hypothetical protein